MSGAWDVVITDRPAVFVGRHAGVSVDGPVVTEGLPRAVAGVSTSHWIILDPWAFPWEYLSDAQWDAPIAAVLSSGFATDRLVDQLADSLLSRLTPFDTVIAVDPLWQKLSARYAWPSTMWERPAGRIPSVARHLLRRAGTIERLGEALGEDALHYAERWDLRTHANKARFRAEAAALTPLVADAFSRRVHGMRWNVIDVGADTGRYVGLLRLADTTVTAMRYEPQLARHLRFNYPDVDVRELGGAGHLGQHAESVDLVLTSVNLASMDEHLRDRMLNTAWQALRVGGTLVVLQRFLRAGGASDIVRLIADASRANGVLDSLHAIRNPATGRVDGAVFAFSKIGVPTTW